MIDPCRLYRYVGPPDIREEARAGGSGRPVARAEQLRAVARAIAGPRATDVTLTFVVDALGTLRVADRSSEHVACAGGGPVMSAGEITVGLDAAPTIHEVTHQSTGYGPEASSWVAVASALERSGIATPGGWSSAFELRRCPGATAAGVARAGGAC